VNGDNLVFSLPGYLEEDLFALPVMMNYLAARVVVGRHPESVTLICRNEELHKLADAFWKDITVISEITSEVLEKADFIFEFDTENAYQITKNVKKHISEAYGIQLGVALARILPPVLVEDVKEIPGRVLVVERNHRDRYLPEADWEFDQEFLYIAKQQKIPAEFLYSVASYEQIRMAVGRCSVVVGPRSTATLIAAAAGKIVLELYPDTEYPNWMGKFECRSYKMVCGKLSEMGGELVWGGVISLVEELKKLKKAA
jgi:hypothetical protein